jgi:hypothetical protein
VQGNQGVTHDIGFGPCADVVQTDVVKADVRASVGLKITGRVATATPIAVIEYFHTGFGHYFMTADPTRSRARRRRLRRRVHAHRPDVHGARRPAAARSRCAASSPSRSREELALLHGRHARMRGAQAQPNWQYEKLAFSIPLPKAGICPTDTVPVYRLYNNGMTGAPNHRFTTSLAIHDDFVQNRGWVSEGVRFCAPI